MPIWAEVLECRTLMASHGAAVLWEDRQVLLADRHKIQFDNNQIHIVAILDRLAALRMTNSDQSRIRLDRAQLRKDEHLHSATIAQDLINLESDEQRLHLDFLSARTVALNDVAPLNVQLMADRRQRQADYRQYLADGGI